MLCFGFNVAQWKIHYLRQPAQNLPGLSLHSLGGCIMGQGREYNIWGQISLVNISTLTSQLVHKLKKKAALPW